ncbi:MAG: glycogen synthase GlgA [Deltaproteobacteria bacterium]|nr:glycogen synthase GlgA [Deltaproteobacteria bacterium]
MSVRVIIVSSEVIPFSKTGGLADVAGALPVALKKLGAEVSVFTPFYREVADKKLKLKNTGKVVSVPIGRRVVTGEILEGETQGVPVYFIKKDEFFDRSFLYTAPEGDYFDNLERFTFFSRAVLEAAHVLGLKPDVIHCNDWQSGLIPAYIKSVYSHSYGNTATMFTIHNLAYQGTFPAALYDTIGLPGEMFSMEGFEFYGQLNLLKGGIAYSDVVTTVSEGYAREVQTKEYGCGLEGMLKKRAASLHGILNGVDYDVWDPSVDSLIVKKYSAGSLNGKVANKSALTAEYGITTGPKTPVIGLISRFADQKGFDILSDAMESIMAMDVCMVILGSGDVRYQRLFEALAVKFKGKLGVRAAFDNRLSHLIEAGSDMFLMPSRYEPCGLNQIYSLRYGTVPVVRATGGLDDTIRDYAGGSGNGFKFKDYSWNALLDKLTEAVTLYKKDQVAWQSLMKKGMAEDFSWDRSARRYMELYGSALAEKKT